MSTLQRKIDRLEGMITEAEERRAHLRARLAELGGRRVDPHDAATVAAFRTRPSGRPAVTRDEVR